MGEDISLRILFRRGSTTKVSNNILYSSVVEVNSSWREIERGKGG